MEGRSPPKKAFPGEAGKGEIKQEATGPSPERPPFDDSEPPPLEDASETHSKGSSPRISSLSEDLEKGFSPRSSYSRKGNTSVSSSERLPSPSPFSHRARSPASSVGEGPSPGPSPSAYAEDVLSPSSHSDSQHGEQLQSNSIPVQNESHPAHAGANNVDHTHSETGISSTANASTAPKPDIKSSLRTSIPILTKSVASAAKHVSFKSSSLSSRSSSAIYGSKPWWKTKSHHMKIVEAALRIAGAILSLIAFSVMCATSETRQGAGSTFKMSFKDYQAYNYLVALNVISFLYSCWQAAAIFLSRIGDIFNTPRERMLFTYICDQILAFLLFSASTAAATASQLSRLGLHNIWPPACATWSLWRFCAQADAAVVMSFFSSFFMISSAVYSGYNVSHSLLE